ncbi:MAG: hypothetical protein FWC71_01545 [Defluviitaleaceae bacterium]|nr:hypothetical protein [Defluviitaleaceae bacterium]
MEFDLYTIDWVAISSIITLFMVMLTFISIINARRANKIANDALLEAFKQLEEYKRANDIAQNSLNEIIIQTKLKEQEIKDEKERWEKEKRATQRMLSGDNYKDIFKDEYGI